MFHITETAKMKVALCPSHLQAFLLPTTWICLPPGRLFIFISYSQGLQSKFRSATPGNPYVLMHMEYISSFFSLSSTPEISLIFFSSISLQSQSGGSPDQLQTSKEDLGSVMLVGGDLMYLVLAYPHTHRSYQAPERKLQLSYTIHSTTCATVICNNI